MYKQVKRIVFKVAVYALVVPGVALSPIAVSASEFLDVTQLDKGIIHIAYESTTNKQLKVMIQKDNSKYTYNLNNNGKKETFPLQLGNGTYKISLYENTTESKYRLITSEVINLDMDDPNDVYLNSIQNIQWNQQMTSVQYAARIMTLQVRQDATSVLHQMLVDNYTYDYEKLATLPTTYLPSVEEIFTVKTGICYDFSALYAAMLRSQGIPTKLVKGYTPNAEGYHAWNEAYDKERGAWFVIDATYDLQVNQYGLPFEMIKPSEDYQKVNEY